MGGGLLRVGSVWGNKEESLNRQIFGIHLNFLGAALPYSASTFVKDLLCHGHSSKHFTQVRLFNLHCQVDTVFILKVKQLISAGAGIQTEEIQFQAYVLNSMPHSL